MKLSLGLRKTILINIGLISAFSLAVLLVASLSSRLVKFYISSIKFAGLYNDHRASLPALINNKDSLSILAEHNMLASIYEPFLMYERAHFSGKYVNVIGPLRYRKSLGGSMQNSTWFFGGSTVFGTGVNDYETLPSHFSGITGSNVMNFGTDGWNTRQALIKYINLISKVNVLPKRVIFYFGVNDVSGSCLSINGHERRHKRAYIVSQKTSGSVRLFNLVNMISGRNFNIYRPWYSNQSAARFDCDLNFSKASTIAKNVANELYLAYSSSKANGIKFSAILQPSIYTALEHNSGVDTDSLHAGQYQIMYPLFIEEINNICNYDVEFCSRFIDGSSWLDSVNEPIFFDEAHLNSIGNKIIAIKIAEKI